MTVVVTFRRADWVVVATDSMLTHGDSDSPLLGTEEK